jgi:hypothetical protein
LGRRFRRGRRTILIHLSVLAKQKAPSCGIGAFLPSAHLCASAPFLRGFTPPATKYYRDLKNSIDTAFDDGDALGFVRGLVEGEEIGLAKGQEIGLAKGQEIGLAKGQEIGLTKGQEIGSLNARQEIAHSLLDLIPDNATLAAKTGLSAAQVQALRNEGKSS